MTTSSPTQVSATSQMVEEEQEKGRLRLRGNAAGSSGDGERERERERFRRFDPRAKTDTTQAAREVRF